ncbi:hypothetical protein TRAPUB_4390 [Trametes pubescens]|uniref:Uncharacterized protein n=1 Tax=Trametes pubescens TaxID=154538 RepID=A0A1M2VB23_TRAPU|nr:hypothetical protein TRAPUB_4390 [Trametes pubescens]
MPGANYMGGRRCASLIAVSILFAKYGGLGLSRNAARARGKDATGKAQRSHFGKKRFEILRTGLSKGQASGGRTTDQAGNGSKGRAEISLAHARRDQAPERQNEASVRRGAFSLPPSESPDHFQSCPSSHLPDSEDIPQASFSLSPPAKIVPQSTPYGSRLSYDEDVACGTGYDSTNDSVYSLLGDSLDHYEQDDASLNNNFADTQQITLACILNGALFEDSDPWHTLDEILDLPPPPTVLRDIEPGPFCLVSSCDRSGVGYTPATAAGPGTPDLRSISLELSAYADDEPGEDDCIRDGSHNPCERMPEDPGAEAGRLLNSCDPFPGTPQRGSSSDVATEGVKAALPTREMSADPIPTLALPSILASNLEASLEPSVGAIEDGQQDAQMVMSCRNTSLPADVAVQDDRSCSPMVAIDVGRRRSCSELHDGMLDGPSLFLDDGLSDEEE